MVCAMSAQEAKVDLRRARGVDTKTQILDAAREALAKDGYSRTTTRAISERAGVQLSLVHYHFGGKQQLLEAVLARENERLLERQRALFEGPEPLADKWRAACAYLREDVRSGYVRILWELWAVGLSEPELAASWRHAISGWRELLTQVGAEWQAALDFELPVSPQALATLADGVFLGAEAEILAGFTEKEAPHLEALESIADLIEWAERRSSNGRRR
jgi:AcrR family transcriptional regulator